MQPRLHSLGVRAAGPSMALAGGLLASAAMAASACVQWALSGTPADAPAALLRALHDLAFVTGGPWRAAGLGLLLAGVAVSSGDHRLLSRPVWIAGVVLAVLCELATLTLALPAAYLIPLRRFGGLAWLIVAGLHLPVRRAHRGTAAAPAGGASGAAEQTVAMTRPALTVLVSAGPAGIAAQAAAGS